MLEVGGMEGCSTLSNPDIQHFSFSPLTILFDPDQVAQLVRVSPQYAKVAGSIPGQGTYKYQPMNA